MIANSITVCILCIAVDFYFSKLQYFPIINCTIFTLLQVMCRFVHYSPVPDSVWMPWLNLFGFFWAMAFVSAFAEMVLAHAFATW